MQGEYLFAMSNDRTTLFGAIPGKGEWKIPGQNPAEAEFSLQKAAATGATPPTGETPRQQPLVAGAPVASNAPPQTLEQGYRQWFEANRDESAQIYAGMFEQQGA